VSWLRGAACAPAAGHCKLAATGAATLWSCPALTVGRADAKDVGPVGVAQGSPVDVFLAAVENAAIESCSVWAPGAVLDATVPNWRFRRTGSRAVREEYAQWFADPGRFEELRRFPHPSGETVAYLLTWVQDGVPHAARHVHVLEVDHGAIIADTVVCGGRWPASLLADMQAAQDVQDTRVDA